MTASADLADPNVFASAIDWLNATLLGTLASSVAVLAVASIGFLLLGGRLDIRRAVQIILGCFILFGASTITGGIMGAVSGSGPSSDVVAALPTHPISPVTAAAPAASSAFDPYAGAALPSRP